MVGGQTVIVPLPVLDVVFRNCVRQRGVEALVLATCGETIRGMDNEVEVEVNIDHTAGGI